MEAGQVVALISAILIFLGTILGTAVALYGARIKARQDDKKLDAEEEDIISRAAQQAVKVMELAYMRDRQSQDEIITRLTARVADLEQQAGALAADKARLQREYEATIAKLTAAHRDEVRQLQAEIGALRVEIDELRRQQAKK